MRCTPMRYTPMRCTPMRCTPVRCTPMRYTPVRCTPVRYTPMRHTPMRYMPLRCTPERFWGNSPDLLPYKRWWCGRFVEICRNSDLNKSTTVCKVGDLEYTRP